MNIENQNESMHQLTVGQLLSRAREKLGISQESIAERLRLNVGVVREIDEDVKPTEIGTIFMRGHMRSYAKLVQVSEKELLALLDQDRSVQPVVTASLPKQQALSQKSKKRENWFLKMTWIIVLALIAMVGVWWWQDHQAQKQEIISLVHENETRIAKEDKKVESRVAASVADTSMLSTSSLPSESVPRESATQVAETVPLPGTSELTLIDTPPPVAENMSVSSVQGTQNVVSADDALAIEFTDPCWLQVNDSKGKVLFSGSKIKGDRLVLTGEEPYKLKIGAPWNVNIQYKGKTVDLDKFVKSRRTARVIVPVPNT